MTTLGRVDCDTATFTSGAAIKRHARVKLVAGKLQECAGIDPHIGHAMRAASAADELIAVRLTSAPSFEAIAASAVAVGDTVGGVAAGKVDNPGTLGVAITAATANNDIIVYIKTAV